ncbi:hypothetical protein MN116_000222, partial [Schistosoma mekongi]
KLGIMPINVTDQRPQMMSKLVITINAEHGIESSRRRGIVMAQDGKDLIIRVPAGVTVLFGGQGTSSSDGSEQRIIGNLDKAGQKLLVAQGGMGGFHQNGYIGTPGQAHSIILDLKVTIYLFIWII